MKKKICIVEDELLLAHAMKMSALGDYFEVKTANNGKDGLELIRSEKPDLVLLDLLMPEMNGFETIAAIKADDSIKDTKVIILSNDATEDSKQKALDLGAVDFFVKSESDLSDLAKQIAKILA